MTENPPTAGRDDEGELAGQRVLVVGGAGWMGGALARLAMARGALVFVSGRSPAPPGQLSPELSAAYRSADFSDPGEAELLMRELAPLDHVVVTASGGGSAGNIDGTPPDAARAAFQRFWVSYHALHFAPGVVRDGGSVTLLSGSSSRRPAPGAGVWGALHGSIEALARNGALELAPIRVNVVSPGGIGMQPDRQLAHHRGQPQDVAAMVLALMTSSHVTDTVIDVDGGERLGRWSG